MANIFEYATRTKARFPYLKGLIGVEDLWDLKKEDLNEIYLTLNGMKKGDEGLISDQATDENRDITIKMEIVRYIFTIKGQEAEAALKAEENRQNKQKILDIIAEKKDGALHEKSVEELEEMLKDM